MPHGAVRQPSRRPPSRLPFPGLPVPGSSPAQRRLVRPTPSFNPVQRQPVDGSLPNPTIFSPGRKTLLESQAKDRATLGFGSPGGLTRQGLSAKLAGVGKGASRVATASSPAQRDPFAVANERRLKQQKPVTRASVNASGGRR